MATTTGHEYQKVNSPTTLIGINKVFGFCHGACFCSACFTVQHSLSSMFISVASFVRSQQCYLKQAHRVFGQLLTLHQNVHQLKPTLWPHTAHCQLRAARFIGGREWGMTRISSSNCKPLPFLWCEGGVLCLKAVTEVENPQLNDSNAAWGLQWTTNCLINVTHWTSSWPESGGDTCMSFQILHLTRHSLSPPWGQLRVLK